MFRSFEEIKNHRASVKRDMYESRCRSCLHHLVIFVGFVFQQLGLPDNFNFEFVNGGHGVKNPMANERALEVEKLPPISE